MGLWIPTTRVQCENGEEYDDPSEDMLHDLLSELSWPWNRFLIVDRLTDGSPGDRLVYMQAHRDQDGTYRVEYQEGSLAEHYEAVGIESRREVHAALTSWAYGEDGWHEAFTWTNSGLAVSTAED